MTESVFLEQINRLRVLRFVPADFAGYFDVLSNVPDEVFGEAVTLALRSRVEFPTPSELRADTTAVYRSRPVPVGPTRVLGDLAEAKRVEIPNPFGGKPIVLLVTREWYHDCDACHDTGWREWWCLGQRGGEVENGRQLSAMACGRTHDHAPHPWAERCPCVATNPTIRRHRHSRTAA